MFFRESKNDNYTEEIREVYRKRAGENGKVMTN